MDIRPASVENIAELNELVHSAYRGEGSKRGWTTEADLLDGTRTTSEILKLQIEEKDSNILIYIDLEKFPNGRILGCVHVQKVIKKGEDKCYIGLLTVSPELQDNGIGKKLLYAAHDWAKENKCASLYMTVLTARTELIAWYERHGFKHNGDTEPFFSDPIYGIPKQNLIFNVYEKHL